MSDDQAAKTPKEIFDLQIDEALRLFSFNQEISTIIRSQYNGLANRATAVKAHSVARLAIRLSDYMDELWKHEKLQAPFRLLYDNGLVMSVGYLENYLKRSFCLQISKQPDNIIERLEKIEVLKGEIKVPLDMLKHNGLMLGEYLGELILQQDKSINFQDLQSTIRTLDNYIGTKLNNTIDASIQDAVILCQACRHVIIHKAGIVDSKFIYQVKKTKI